MPKVNCLKQRNNCSTLKDFAWKENAFMYPFINGVSVCLCYACIHLCVCVWAIPQSKPLV